MQIAVIGLDLARNVFQVHAVGGLGQAVLKRKLRRSEVLPFFAELEPALVGIEACHTAHYWGRELAALGHDVRLMPPQFVKPYVKSQKNDAADAEAIAEAVQRPTMRFAPIKSADQQAVLMLHRTRDLLIRQRSSLISAIRAHFAEFGIVVGQGIRNVERLLGLLESAGDQRLPALAAELLGILAAQLRDVAERVKEVEVKLLAWHRADETSRHLRSVPGLGPITASAIVATVGDASQFKSGRQFAARLGLVPQQRSSGGKERLGGHQQTRRRLHPALAGARRSCDCWMAEAVGHAQNAMDRAAVGAPANQCCNSGLRQQVCAHRLGDHDAWKSIQSCFGICRHPLIGRRNRQSG
jgi:transposase